MSVGGLQVFRSRVLVIGAAQAVVWAVLCFALTVAASSVAKAFKANNTTLPDITSVILDFTLVVRRFWYCGLAGACLWPVVNWGMVRLLSRDPEAFILRRLWYLATWIVPIVAAVFALVALMVPLMLLHRQLPSP